MKSATALLWLSDVSTPHNSLKQPLGSEVCYLVYKVIANKVFKQKKKKTLAIMKPIPSVKAPLTSPAISRAARLLNCSAGAACVRNTEAQSRLCVSDALKTFPGIAGLNLQTVTHTRFEFIRLKLSVTQHKHGTDVIRVDK